MNTDRTTPEAPQPPQEPAGKKCTASPERQKSVIIYILLLFVVAFLLMAFSLLTHQRDNTEALGQLKDSISAMKDAENLQEQVIQLQDDLEEARDMAAAFEDACETARNQASHAEFRLEQTAAAMDWFWQLNEAYILRDTQRCEEILEEMNRNPEDSLSEYLSQQAADRYAEILAALGKS